MLTRSRSGVDWSSWPDLDCFKQFTDQLRLSIIPQQCQYRYTSFRMLDIRLKDDQSIQLSEMLLKGLAWAPALGKILKMKMVTFLKTGEGLESEISIIFWGREQSLSFSVKPSPIWAWWRYNFYFLICCSNHSCSGKLSPWNLVRSRIKNN